MQGIPVPVTAGTLTGTTLAANVVNSSLQTLGTLTKLAIAQGTITTALSPLAITETRNNAGTVFPGITYTITDSASAAGSMALQIAGATPLFSVDRAGQSIFGTSWSALNFNGLDFRSSNGISWSSGSTFSLTKDLSLNRISASLLGIGNSATTGFGGSLKLTKLFVDDTNTATVGNVTINKCAGQVILGAAGTSLTLTNSLITATSHIFLNADSSPGNIVAVQLRATPSAGSAVITATPAVTNQTVIDFLVIN